MRRYSIDRDDAYRAEQHGKDWKIIDTATGEAVRSFHSRRGLPASSLACRALNQCKDMNDCHSKGMVLIGGYMRPAPRIDESDIARDEYDNAGEDS